MESRSPPIFSSTLSLHRKSASTNPPLYPIYIGHGTWKNSEPLHSCIVYMWKNVGNMKKYVKNLKKYAREKYEGIIEDMLYVFREPLPSLLREWFCVMRWSANVEISKLLFHQAFICSSNLVWKARPVSPM